MNSTLKTVIVSAVAATCLSSASFAEEQEDYARWYFSPSIGWLDFEGDEPLEDGAQLALRIGYDANEWFSFEGGVVIAPKLNENLGGYTMHDETGWHRLDVRDSYSRGSDEHFGDTFMFNVFGDALLHFTRWERLDPFLAAGLGLNFYGKDVVKGGNAEFVIRAGGGVMYHLSDEWALRADLRLLLASDNTEFNALVDVGLAWYWGAAQPPAVLAVEGPIDSDGDGLSDDLECQIGTDPQNPDSDGDGLLDGEEYLQYKTDPLNPDTDFDLLKDGEEVRKYKTDPLDPDTDKGGVTDGHEVLEDGTDPLNANDDFLKFDLRLLFDYDKDVIHSEDFAKLDQVVAILKDHPNATATIEGHADQLARSKAKYNRDLSLRRAKAVKKYFEGKGVAGSRLSTEGYGFDRPQIKPDLVNGTPGNRRVEVYIRGASDRDISDTLKKQAK